jgi:two-component system, NarL family, nitrate/nitrite response regulator NarL
MNGLDPKTSVAVCETQPLVIEGVKAVLQSCPDLAFSWAEDSLRAAVVKVRTHTPEILLIDKGLGIYAVLHWLAELARMSTPPAAVVWGASITEAEALRFVQGGARGILRKAASGEVLVTCLRSVASGTSWMEDSLFRESQKLPRQSHSDLTPRENQVLQLVEQGLKNIEIARELGIRPSTVKIHVKHIFEKTGIRGRYGLALSGLKEKGLLTLSA